MGKITNAGVTKVGVIGAGQMGSGIAQVCATSGYNTILWDADDHCLDRGFQSINQSLAQFLAKEKISPETKEQIENRITRASVLGEFSECDLVIEAIIENAEIKHKLFHEIDHLIKPETIVASNTSSISITYLASALSKPEQFMGIHFMNPVPIMRLVELIRGLQTSDATYESVTSFCKTLHRTTVLAPDAPGFIVNRILCPMLNEAIFLLQEGCTPEDVDTSMKLGTNHPMGPLELADFVGLDTLLYILNILHRELGEDKYRPCPLLTRYVEAGWLGKKSGRGFYRY
jgi:3-hydroxybutyryl-CoA dehydrogenase